MRKIYGVNLAFGHNRAMEYESDKGRELAAENPAFTVRVQACLDALNRGEALYDLRKEHGGVVLKRAWDMWEKTR